MNANEKLLSVKEASSILGVNRQRIQQLIESDRLPAQKVGAYYIIKESDLGLVAERKVGRPPKTENGIETEVKEKPFKTIFDVAPDLIGSIKSGLPTDLSSNKEYLKDLGKKSAEKAALQSREEYLKDNE